MKIEPTALAAGLRFARLSASTPEASADGSGNYVKMIRFLLLIAASCSIGIASAQTTPLDILAVTDDAGDVAYATSANQWQPRRREILTAMESVMGPLPRQTDREPPAMTILKEVDCDSYIRREISYQSQPGCDTPAYLCIPKGALRDRANPVPAVLCLHPTDNVVGHDVVVGLGGRPNRQYASELAARGYVTLAPSYPLLADYQPELKQLGWESGTLKAVWDNIRGIDLLQSLPYVRDRSIGAIGHSLGGHNSVYTAVFDDRIGAVVSSCGLDSYRDYYGGDPARWVLGQGWTSERYMPRLAPYRGRLDEIPFDFDQMLAALAPRSVLVIAPLHDSNFRADSVDRVTDEARKVFALHGQPNRLQVLHPDCKHDFPDQMRQRAYEMFDAVLKRE
jgi:dienelactone hydrolase